MPAPTLNLPRLRLTRQAKVLLAIASLLLLTAPLLPFLWSRLAGPKAPELIDTGLPCDGAYWPAQASLVMVTLDIGNVKVTRPGLVLVEPRVIYLCTTRSAP